MRNMSCFGKTFKKAANLRIDPPKLPRKRRALPRAEGCLGGYAAPEFVGDIVSYYRRNLR